MLVACMAMRYILQSLDSSSGKKNMYICNANMIIPFVNNRTPKKKKLNMYLNCISNSKIS